MPAARIFKRIKNPMQSGQGRTDGWTLEFEPAEAKRPDPLTGWAGSGDVSDQVRLGFSTAEAAVAYAERQGWAYVVVPTPAKTLKLQAYADNFR